MDLQLLKEIVLVAMFLVVLFCVFVPLKFAATARESGIDIFHSERYAGVVSALNCFVAGIFLGTCLLHLFPDVRASVSEALEQISPGEKFPFAEFTIAIGFFVLLTIEQIISDVRERNFSLDRSQSESTPILRNSPDETSITDYSIAPSEIAEHRQNTAIRAIAMIIALSIHATFEGIAIGVQTTEQAVLQITGALILHKVVIAFSLGLTLSQSTLSAAKCGIGSISFAIASPLGIGIGLLLTTLETLNGSLLVGSLQGMAAGTFLYVTFLEVLPHEFRSGHLHLPKLLSFIFGFSVICLVLMIFPDD